jgi:predicted DNA-binding transcriptional regulator AlpA
LERDVPMKPNAADDLPALISVPVAAKILGLKRASAYRYAANGELPVKRLGGRVYIITAKIRPLLDGTEGTAA